MPAMLNYFERSYAVFRKKKKKYANTRAADNGERKKMSLFAPLNALHAFL